jgi:MSHA biogenesis protein MshP
MKAIRGFSLPTAIFLLVILALLGAFMISLSSTQNVTSAQDVQGFKAPTRRRGAGMEWALYNLKLPATALPGIADKR